MNLLHWNMGGSSYHCEELLFFNPYVSVQLVKRDIVTGHHHLLLHSDQNSLREMWLNVWRCYVWGKR